VDRCSSKFYCGGRI